MRDKEIIPILLTGFFIGMVWDGVTTFLGVVSIIGGPEFTLSLNMDGQSFGIYGIAFVGTVIVFSFNLITRNVWEEVGEGSWKLVMPWLMCVVFDFCTSLWGNYRFILPERQSQIAVIGVIWFVTFLTTVSPMSVRYLIKEYTD